MKTIIKNMKNICVKSDSSNNLKDLGLPPKSPKDIHKTIEQKMIFFQEVIQKTILYVSQNKLKNILGLSDVNNCMNIISNFIKHIKIPIHNDELDKTISSLQIINNEISALFKLFGTSSLADLLFICFGNNTASHFAITDLEKDKFELLLKYFHPTSYKVSNKSDVGDPPLKCSDISVTTKPFYMKTHGIQLFITHLDNKKSLYINGYVDDVMIDLFSSPFVSLLNEQISKKIPEETDFKLEAFGHYLKSLMLKDYLIYDHADIYSKYIGHLTNERSIIQKTIPNIVKEFINNSLFVKRNTIMALLFNTNKNESQYLAYLLYDLLTNDVNRNVDTTEQNMIFDSFPLYIQQLFRSAMKKTIQYTNDLLDYDINKIPIEQQICLMNAGDNVKEKAFQKLKEVKAKSDDSGSKARQYLDGLLKIPFNTYKKEPILYLMENIRTDFGQFVYKYNQPFDSNKKYTNIEILNQLSCVPIEDQYNYTQFIQTINGYTKQALTQIIININSFIESYNQINLTNPVLFFKYKSKTNSQLIEQISQFIQWAIINGSKTILNQLSVPISPNTKMSNEVSTIVQKCNQISSCMKEVKEVLDTAVHGHNNAKKQIERIIAQWINGKQDGYCFGFEGPPGVGKTSLAKKGLSTCLKDEHGNGRPFSMIQMGGDSNGSSLHGHNYTYVGSTWGSIVQILIDKKCMNPIIFIDEVDKISKTEHGKEIVGILTHLLDPAQNDSFQDKYFTGIDLDLSKALFILSYNDVEAIDSILLDRIHRIKFSNLSLEDKLVICKTHILPEIFLKMGLDSGIFVFSDSLLTYIIENYTCEPGVRKLKEILFEIIAEINLSILKNNKHDFPIVLTIEDITHKYLKDITPIHTILIHQIPSIGIMNGLWANSMGQGGIIPIQACHFPSTNINELKLTGMQGDVMKESMNVAFTLAWNLTNETIRSSIKNGIHIHCPEGATPKDGPSAGACITTVIYSLLNQKSIPNHIAITGEINLHSKITKIGGLHLKILGALKAGVTEIIYPSENENDYQTFLTKYKETSLLDNIIFHQVSNISEVFSIIFE